jgi:hypothetical protein
VKKYTEGSSEYGFGVSPDLHINYKLIGDWQRANFMLSEFPILVTRAVNNGNRKFARKYQQKVKENILNDGANLGWLPSRSKKYPQFKARHAESTQQMQFFGALLNNIRTFKNGVMGWSAGIKSGIQNHKMIGLRGPTNLDVAQYAAVNEYGSPSRNIQARPLWNPSYRQLGGNTGLMKEVVIALRGMMPHVRLKLPVRPGRASRLATMR